MLAVRLPEELERRLADLARSSNRSKSFYVREAIAAYLDDLEDIHQAETVLKRVREGSEQLVSSEEFWSRLDD